MSKNFKVQVTKSKDEDGDIDLTTTRNGFQWYTNSYAPEDLKKIAESIIEYFENAKDIVKEVVEEE